MPDTPNDWPHAAARVAHERPISTALAALFILFLFVWLLWPRDAKRADEARIQADLSAGEVTKIAEAPDGAAVWAVVRNNQTIYFSKGSVAIPADPKDPSGS